MNERIKQLAEQAIVVRKTFHGVEHIEFDKEKFAKLIVNDMMTHLAAHALSGSSAMDVYVQWKEMYEGETIDRGPKLVTRNISDFDF